MFTLKWFTLITTFASNSFCINNTFSQTKENLCNELISSGNCTEHESQNFCCLPVKLAGESCNACKNKKFCCREHHCCFQNQTKKFNINETSSEGKSPFQWQHYYEVFIIMALLFVVCICCLRQRKLTLSSIPYQSYHGRDLEGIFRRVSRSHTDNQPSEVQVDDPPLYSDVVKDFTPPPPYPGDNI